MLKNAHESTQTPRLVERNTQDDGALTEVFEVAPGELVVVESWSVEEVTVPARPSARRQ
ncbi:MAG: hypothetical protein H0T65_05740 [Deltaproteobacteria bacterium]|nr:hypothetical protein [Deltaproteobacteria bacterium]